MRELQLPKAIKTKIDLWQIKNQEFKDAIAEGDSVKLVALLEDGYPSYLHECLSEKEQQQLGDDNYEDLTDDCYRESSESIENLFLSTEIKDKDYIIELLANYFMFQKNEHAFRFRRNYFCYTKNHTDALKYAETLITSFGFLKTERSSWLLGALYNESEDFFDSFYELYKEAYEPTGSNEIFTLTGKILDGGKYYNINSWIKHFDFHLPSLIQKRYRVDQDNDIDVYSIVILDLIKYPLDVYENGSEVNKLKVKPIIDFLLEEHSSTSITCSDKLEYMMVNLYFEKERELIWEISRQATTSANVFNPRRIRGVRRNFKSLFLESALEANTKDLDKYLKKSIAQNDAMECLYVFQNIGLPKEKYEVLTQYVSLTKDTHISQEEKLIKKVSKI